MTALFDFYDNAGYLQELTKRANAAGRGDHITVMAMAYAATVPEINTLADALTAAASRGAGIRLILDAYSFLLDRDDHLGPLLTAGKIQPQKLHGSFKQTYASLEQLKAAGGAYHILNLPDRAFRLPYAGRSHIKLAIVNDQLFIGGCNLDSADQLDVMVAWQNQPTVSAVQALIDKIVDRGTVRDALEGQDQTLVLGDDNDLSIFVDCGIRRQSVILQNAYQLIDEATQKIVITCQFFPGRETARRLLAAHKRGVDVTIYYSHPAAHGRLALAHRLYTWRERLSLPATFFEHRLTKDSPKLHAKILITESAAMVGSHNYVINGVNFGTAEIALLNRQQDFIQRIGSLVNQLVAN